MTDESRRDATEVRGGRSAELPERAEMTEWLARRLGAAHLSIDGLSDAPLNGASNETLIVDTTWTGIDGDDHAESFVVRRPPKSFPLFHRYDLEQQYRTMEALAGSEVPVPPLVGLELDPGVIGEPFYVMRKVEGRPPPDLPPFTAIGWVLESSPDDQAALYAQSIEMLARVHRLDLARIDVDFLRTRETTSGFGDQFAATERWYRWAAEGEPQPVLDATLEWLRAHRPSDPPDECLNWGDARIGNMLYRGLEPVVVLDWEMAAIGPAEVDLGWWLFLNRHHTEGMGLAPLPGFPDDGTTVSMYSEALGRPARDVFYYDVLGGFRFGIIVLRAARRLALEGALPPGSNYARANGATRLLAQMLDLPEPG